MIAYLTMLVTWAVLGLPVAAVAIPWTLLSGRVELLYMLGLGVMRAGLHAAGIRIVVEGKAQVPTDQPCLYIANHQSNLDPPLLAGVQPANAAAMVKDSIMRIPLLGLVLRLARCISVERSGKLSSAKQSLRAAGEVLRSGLSLTVFPEGTRSESTELLPFKKGPFFLAMQTGVTVVPVTISGTGAMLGKGSQQLRPGIAHVFFHAPIDPRQFSSRDELQAAVRAAIASALPSRPRVALPRAKAFSV